MPQMSPMWWMYMMLLFILCLMMMNSIIYFNYMVKNNKQTMFNYSNMIWKW